MDQAKGMGRQPTTAIIILAVVLGAAATGILWSLEAYTEARIMGGLSLAVAILGAIVVFTFGHAVPVSNEAER